MPEETSSSRLTDRWQDSSRLSQVKVVVCTANCIFVGYTYRLHQQRLLDALNKGFVAGQLHVGQSFMPLTGVKVCLPAGKEEYMESTYIRKANILFVGEKNGQQPGTPEAREQSKIYPFREKKALKAKVHMPLYTLVGSMHGEMWEQLLDALNKDELFLPLTNVELSPGLESGDSTFGFVAVNKDQIIYVGELGPNP